MQLIDWSIVAALALFLVIVGLRCIKYTRNVADYLAANRCAGRYILGLSEGAAGVGAISFIAAFEMYYKAGFSIAWWGLIMIVVQIVASVTGWVTYRFRQTRAMTIAEFLEKRYSRRFRIFAGMLAFLAGILNFGIFPAVSARFFMYFCGLPGNFLFLGFHISTYAVLMAGMIAFALFFTYIGMIAIMVTDFLQGIFVNVIFLTILIFLLVKFDWNHITAAMAIAPKGESLLNPFQTSDARDFNIWFYLISAFGTFYTLYSWQGCQGYQVSAISAQESMMSKMLQTAKTQIQSLQLIIIPVAAYAFLHHQDFTSSAAQATSVLSGITNETIRGQMTTPVALRFILPVGLVGCMCAIMFSAFVSNHDIYLLSWGSVFVQDVILPFRKKPLDAKQHIKYLRLSVFGVAIFIYIFSLIFRPTQYIYMYFAITGAVWMGGAGSVIIGGLYWKRGTTAAAYCALIIGSLLAVSGIVLEQVWPMYHNGTKFFINGQWMWLIAMVSSIIIYIVVSLLDKSFAYELDKLLHRGKYSVEQQIKVPASKVTKKGIMKIFSLGPEFSKRDIFTYWFCLGCTALLVVVFVTGTIYNLLFKFSDSQWSIFWKYFMLLVMVLGTILAFWISFGGLVEMPSFFARLRNSKRDDSDDGQIKTDRKTNEMNFAAENEKSSVVLEK